MKTVTVTYNLYQYDELSDDAKEKALEWAADINVDFDWWDFDGLTGFSSDEIRQYRLGNPPDDLLKYKNMYFDIDRGGFIQFVGAEFADDEIARKFLGVHRSLWEQVYWTINEIPYRETNTRLEYEPQDSYKEFTPKQIAILDRAVERFADKMHKALYALRDEYEGATSREAIEDTIRANEYTFDVEGNRKN